MIVPTVFDPHTLAFLGGWFWHPLQAGNGYNFWSGIAGSFATNWINPGILIGGYIFLRHHNCHVKGCKSVLTSQDPAVHAPACKHHHSHGHLQGSVPPHALPPKEALPPPKIPDPCVPDVRTP
jgi:hypothetical protein